MKSKRAREHYNSDAFYEIWMLSYTGYEVLHSKNKEKKRKRKKKETHSWRQIPDVSLTIMER